MLFRTYCQQARLFSIVSVGTLKAPTYQSCFSWRNSADQSHHDRADRLISFIFERTCPAWLGTISISANDEYCPSDFPREYTPNIYLGDGLHRLATLQISAKVLVELGQKFLKEEAHKGTPPADINRLRELLDDELLRDLSSLNLECKTVHEDKVININHLVDQLKASILEAYSELKSNHSISKTEVEAEAATDAPETDIGSSEAKNYGLSVVERIAHDEIARINNHPIYMAYTELRRKFQSSSWEFFYWKALCFVERIHSITMGLVVTASAIPGQTSREELETHIQTSHFLK